MKKPKTAFVSTLADLTDGVVLSPQDTLRDDNPHVLARPDMFEEADATFRGRYGNEMEEATARPGDRRNR
jgi:hypothetical protein